MSGKPLLILLLILPLSLFATTFTVTTTSDNGAGSFREALQNALGNGTSETDSIVFAIANVSVPGRTITIESELPAIAANTVINGITQPGLPFGLSDARVKIEPGASFPSTASMLTVSPTATDVAIYGLSLAGNSLSHISNINSAILVSNSTNIIIGSGSMGNVITGFKTGILFSGAVSQDITIVYNIIGLNDTTNIPNSSATNEISIDAENVYNLTVSTNIIYGTTNAFKFNTNIKGIQGALNFINNKIGTDIFGFALKAYPASQLQNLVYISGNSTNGQYDSLAVFNINIQGNIVTGNALTGIYLSDGLTNVALSFTKNTIGTDKSGQITASKISQGVYIGYVGRPWGSSQLSPADFSGNKIFLCSTAGVTQEYSYIYFNGNQFHCNKEGIVTIGTSDNNITITSATASTITGTCSADDNIIIDLYIASGCAGNCQGYSKITSFVKTGNATTWSYCGYIHGNIVALSSYPGKNYYSSNFSNCVQSPNNTTVTNATCKNRKAGAIKGVITPAGSTIIWRNIDGDSITNTNDLVNISAGRYYYEVQSPECNYSSDTFQIIVTGYPGLDETYTKVFPEVCGKDGSIDYIRASARDSIRWIDTLGNLVSNSLILKNQSAGRYRMLVGRDSGCIVSSRWYTIVDTTTRIDNNAVTVTKDTCNSMSGSITYGATLPADYFFWWNDPNNISRDTNTYRIDTLNPGDYTLNIQRVTYDSSCTSTYGPYTVVKIPGISFNTLNLNIQNASCNNSNGSITNMSISNQKGNVNYQWVDSTGKVTGTGIDLLNIPGGQYRLQCKDESGCDTFYSNYFTVLNNGVINIDTANLLVKAASCIGPDGFIRNIAVTNATSYQWIDAGNNTNLASTVNLENAAAGTYQLILNNALGCETRTNIITVPQSVFDTISVTKDEKNDAHCNLVNGSVKLLLFSKDTSLYKFEWINNANNNVIGTSHELTNLDSGTYKYYATDTNGCKGNIYTANIIQTGVPTIDGSGILITNDSCSLSKGSLYNVIAQGGGGQYTWQWYDNTTQQAISSSKALTNIAAGNYFVVAKDQYECSVTSSVYTIGNTNSLLPLPTAADVNILRGNTATIKIQNPVRGMYTLYSNASSSVGMDSSTNGVLQTPALNSDQIFYVRLQSGSCFSDYGPVKVFVFDKSTLIIPNAFSPNGDGINDTWVLTEVGIVTLDNLTVFNRWGQPVYTTKDAKTQWKGTMNGNPLPLGTYYYTIQARDIEGKPFKQNGYVVILR